MLNKVIDLYEFAGASTLSTRQIARDLFNVIKSTGENRIILDFTNIKFASRSFFDELHSKKSQIKLLGKELEFKNLHELNTIFQLVKNTSSQSNQLAYKSTASADTLTI